MTKVRWGVLGAAKIAVEKVIPAMQQGSHCQIVGLASRSLERAKRTADRLQIPKAYGSYEELLADGEIDAIYNPLPNHLHVSWSVKCLEADKHVLCEKPIGLSADDAETLLAASKEHPELKMMEAFMYRHHPQWIEAKRLVSEEGIGTLCTIDSFFSYFNLDHADIRNQANMGGGGLMDIGCYPISLSRFLFEAEPKQVLGTLEYDGKYQVDRRASAILDFGVGTSIFTCGTQLTPFQRVNIFGTEGRIEIEIPFNAPPDRPCRLWHQTDDGTREVRFEKCNQYTIQGDLFSQAVLNDSAVPTPPEDAVANMRVIDAVFRSGMSRKWECP